MLNVCTHYSNLELPRAFIHYKILLPSPLIFSSSGWHLPLPRSFPIRRVRHPLSTAALIRSVNQKQIAVEHPGHSTIGCCLMPFRAICKFVASFPCARPRGLNPPRGPDAIPLTPQNPSRIIRSAIKRTMSFFFLGRRS